MMDPEYIHHLYAKGKEVGEKARAAFSSLSFEQLNWKPGENRWSIGQCLEHLVISDSLYFPVFKKIVADDYEMNFWQRWNPLAGLFGKMLVTQIQEKPHRKLKAPKVLAPSESNIDAGILEQFHEHLDLLLAYIMDCRSVDLDKTHITSPVSGIITYSLRNAFTLLIQHEHRHIYQAMRVKGMTGFPGE